MPTTTPVAGATVNGFCNDITIDSAGNVYATDRGIRVLCACRRVRPVPPSLRNG